MPNKYLFVSFPVDYGNLVLAKNLLVALRSQFDTTHFEFDSGSTLDTSAASKIGVLRRTGRRLRRSVALQTALRAAEQEGRVVLFQQIAPAAFAMPVRLRSNSFILLDWTRKLYERILKQKLSNCVDTFVHRKAMSRVTGVMAFTEAAERSVIGGYGIEADRVSRIPMPFDVARYQMAPAREGKVRLLFVGADFNRKGGGVVLDWFRTRGRLSAELTMVTQSDIRADGVTIIKNKPGDDMASVYAANDVLVLPTRCDAYPQVIGEAACAGLALATTDTALGAPEIIVQGWNGFIAAMDDFQSELDELVSDRPRIEKFKRNSREKMNGFTLGKVASAIDTIVSTTRSGCS